MTGLGSAEIIEIKEGEAAPADGFFMSRADAEEFRNILIENEYLKEGEKDFEETMEKLETAFQSSERRKKIWRGIGIGSLAAAGVLTLVWVFGNGD